MVECVLIKTIFNVRKMQQYQAFKRIPFSFCRLFVA